MSAETEYQPQVFVVGEDHAVESMFENKGWKIWKANDRGICDLICFTGGADVSPELYNDTNNGKSRCDPKRDKDEVELFRIFLETPKVGICRGGQLLNVLSGGKMIQDIPNHHMGVHKIWYEPNWGRSSEVHEVLGDHHQAMIPADNYEGALAQSPDRIPEILWYKGTKSLCFQPHPEWRHKPTEELFFSLLETHYNL